LLGGTKRIAVASAIAVIWNRDPTAMMNAGRTLADAHPERFVLGMGVSHRDTASSRGHRYDKPLQAMRVYLEEMDAAPYDGHPPEFPALRVLAALGPKMTALAGEMTDGVHPFLSTPEHTAATRATVGRGSLVAVEQAVLLTTDAEHARAAARENLDRFLGWPNYRRHVLRLGFDEGDLQNGGTDRLIDALYAWGDETAIQRRAADHIAAGADNVSLQAIPVGEVDEAETLRRLAPAVLSR
jgi:probable F420-dependent oxidoreductase